MKESFYLILVHMFSVKLDHSPDFGPVMYYARTFRSDYKLVCADTFDDNAARVVCRELDFFSGTALYPKAFGYRNLRNGVVRVGDVR